MGKDSHENPAFCLDRGPSVGVLRELSEVCVVATVVFDGYPIVRKRHVQARDEAPAVIAKYPVQLGFRKPGSDQKKTGLSLLRRLGACTSLLESVSQIDGAATSESTLGIPEFVDVREPVMQDVVRRNDEVVEPEFRPQLRPGL